MENARTISVDNVIKFPGATQRLYRLMFTAPQSFEVTKKSSDEVSLNFHISESGEYYGVAMVLAGNKIEARKKLEDIVEVSEWIDEE